ncbi:hypothetical protein [Streptomyces sp. SD15]
MGVALGHQGRQVGPYRSNAWKTPVIADDQEFPGSAYYAYGSEAPMRWSGRSTPVSVYRTPNLRWMT